MTIKRIVYSRTWQVQNFEPERIEAEYVIDENEDITPSQAFLEVSKFVHYHGPEQRKLRAEAKQKQNKLDNLRRDG